MDVTAADGSHHCYKGEGDHIIGDEQKCMKQVTKKILYEKVGGLIICHDATKFCVIDLIQVFSVTT